MKSKEISAQLERIASDDDFALVSETLADEWLDAGVGIEALEPILRFMESHPSIDYGVPGAIVHFAETFYGKGYEDKLVESLKRNPTMATVWMLHRVVNGTKNRGVKKHLLGTLEQTRQHPLADPDTIQVINDLLK